MGLRAVIGGHGRAGGNGDLRRIFFARGSRGLASGYFAVVLGVELHHQGLTGISFGLVLAAVLGGTAGTLSSEIIDSGPFGALEPVMLTAAVTEERRLHSFSRYGAVGTASSAPGALGAGLLRLLARPLGPLLAGVAQTMGLGAPFLVSGVLKGIYDVSLWRWFRRVPLHEGGDHRAAPPVRSTR